MVDIKRFSQRLILKKIRTESHPKDGCGMAGIFTI